MSGPLNITPAMIAHELGPVLALWDSARTSIELLLKDPRQAMGRPLAARAMARSIPEGIAVIDVHGLLVKDESIFTELGLATSTLTIASQVQQARTDPSVRGIFLSVDSPGGSVGGMSEAAAIIRAARADKPVRAHAEFVMASGAYYLGCSAGSVTAVEMSIVGSIGTYATLLDLSKMAADVGIKVHVLRAGKFKGAGTPGAEITAEELAEAQRTVDQLNENFIGAVMAGRKIPEPQAREWNDGRVHVGGAATAIGMVDKIFATSADSLAEFAASVIPARPPAARQADQRPSIAALAGEFEGMVKLHLEVYAGSSRKDAMIECARHRQDLHSAWLKHHSPTANVQMRDAKGKPLSDDHFRP